MKLGKDPLKKVSTAIHFDDITAFQQLQVQKCIYNPVKHLRYSFFESIVNGLQSLTIFAKRFHRRYSTGF